MKRFLRTRLTIVLAAALTAAACAHGPETAVPSAREQLLDQAFSLLDSDPAQAARLFADAGPGPTLETARMESWADCLARISAPSDAWRRYLADSPPLRSAERARLRLIETLVRETDFTGASVERLLLPDDLGPEADEVLLSASDPAIRLDAAQRLAVTAPRRLSRVDNDLDRRLLNNLGPEKRLERARAWRREGSPSRAATELRSQRWSGDTERERRRELARAELDAGSPRGALRVLPEGRNAGSIDLVLRAQAHRNRAWNLWPGRGARRLFADCLSAANGALRADAESDSHRTALVLRLECATEADRLDTAYDSWRQLEADDWNESRRQWLGRRLGYRIAVGGGDTGRTLDIARAIGSQARCLKYWVATSKTPSQAELERLASVPTLDLYGHWIVEALGPRAGSDPGFAPKVAPAAPPTSVQRLLNAGAENEAAREWRRIRQVRQPTPEEAFAGALLATQMGRMYDTITWLRAGFPELGTVHMARGPINAVEAYLPLRWRTALMDAAAEFGLDPWLMAGIARQESTFTAHAVSPRGAVGVMQLLPSTARTHARALGLPNGPDLLDAELNLRLGARELAHLLRRFGAVEPALAAYNSGETRVRGWWKRQPDRHRFTEEIPIPETYNYVRRVIYLSEAYRQLYGEARRNPS